MIIIFTCIYTYRDETRCPIFTDNNILHVATVEALARIISNELMKKNPELLKKINIDEILPLTQHTTNSRPLSSVINNVISKAINQNFEDIINNLRDMSKCYIKNNICIYYN